MTANDQMWLEPNNHMVLPPEQVHLWRLVGLNRFETNLLDHYQILSEEEKKRADNYYFLPDRTRFIVWRRTLRCLLGEYLDIPPDKVLFTYNQYGKPELSESQAQQYFPIQFNISHKKDVGLFAFSKSRRIGVDIENLPGGALSESPQKINEDQIVERFFSPGERKAFAELPEMERRTAFYTIWTCKEAFTKAVGLGLSLPLDQFELSVQDMEAVRLLRSPFPQKENQGWSFRNLVPEPGYIAALAVEGGQWDLTCFNVS